VALDRKLKPAPAAIRQRAATVQRSAAPAARPRARALQERLGNQGTQAFIARAVQSSRTPQSNAPCACATCADCKKTPVQRAATTPAPATLPRSVAAALDRSGGQPLPGPLRQSMESSFSRNFDAVRVFADDHAATATRDASARAFTSGESIYFARGEYQPDSERGRELIAHELTHVAQQKSGRATVAGIGAHDDAFEKEAERAAAAVGRGERPMLATADHGSAVRRATSTTEHQLATNAIAVKLDLPALKTSKKDNKRLEEIYTNAANADALRTTHAGRSRDQGETVTETMWNNWVSNKPASFFEHPEKGKPPLTPQQLIKDRKDAGCHVDHVLELQVGGADDVNNMRLLTGSKNTKAGSQIAGQIRSIYANPTLMKDAKVPPGEDKPIIKFTSIGLDGSPTDDSNCLDWEIERKKGGDFTKPAGAADTIKTKISGSAAQIFTAEKQVVKTSRLAVPGFELGAANQVTPEWNLEGVISQYAKRIPVLKPREKYRFKVPKPDEKLVLEDRSLEATFPNLSKTNLNIDIDGRDFKAIGILKPSHPLFKYVDVSLTLESEKLTAKAEITPDKLKKALPVPGLEITRTDLALTAAASKFDVTGGFALKYTTIADAAVTASFGNDGFEAAGDLNLHIPGLTEAKGRIWYKQSKLAGKVTVGAKQLKVPGVKSANIVFDIAGGVLSGSGDLELAVPGVSKASLHFLYDPKGNFSATGSAALAIPGLREGSSLTLAYANQDLRGAAKLGLAIPGLESATFDVNYAKGIFTGAGQLAFRRGKLTGSLKAALNEKHKLTGGGNLSYELFPGFVAGVGVQILDTGKTKVSGEITVPPIVTLFPEKRFQKSLFSFGVQIPIFAIPLGTKSVGLVADIGSDLKALAGIGPGQLRGVTAKGTIDLSAIDSFQLSVTGELYVPAYADLRLAVHGGIGLSLALASATGGIELAGLLGVHGALAIPAKFTYKGGGPVVFDAKAELTAQPRLRFDVSAYVKVEALFIEVYRKDWKLASREWGSGLTVGLRFPLHYELGKPLSISLDQLQFIRPEIDVKKAVKDLLPF